ncbi:MAG TPA: ABC transporter permease subunit [Candidatus Dormibacteraeota bacterium]|nr:ABC transporter permease subunit [Candidatus Dormibacteraeota bacterium]
MKAENKVMGGVVALGRKWRSIVAFVAPLASLVCVWEILAREVVANPFKMPEPLEVLHGADELWASGVFSPAILVTVERIGIAYGASLIIGWGVGTALGSIPSVAAVLRPIVSFFFTMPKTAIYPSLVIILGLGSSSKIVFGVMLAVFPIILGTATAVSTIDQKLIWSARSLGVSRARTFIGVVIPAMLPGAVAAARVGLVSAVVGVFLGEMMVGADGLGQLMMRMSTALDSAATYACLVTACVIAVAMDGVVLAIGRRLTWWSEG